LFYSIKEVVNAQQSGATVADKWRITPDPSYCYNDNWGFELTYAVSNFIDVGQAGMFYYLPLCDTFLSVE